MVPQGAAHFLHQGWWKVAAMFGSGRLERGNLGRADDAGHCQATFGIAIFQ